MRSKFRGIGGEGRMMRIRCRSESPMLSFSMAGMLIPILPDGSKLKASAPATGKQTAGRRQSR